jgi:hypothetical protein
MEDVSSHQKADFMLSSRRKERIVSFSSSDTSLHINGQSSGVSAVAILYRHHHNNVLLCSLSFVIMVDLTFDQSKMNLSGF